MPTVGSYRKEINPNAAKIFAREPLEQQYQSAGGTQYSPQVSRQRFQLAEALRNVASGQAEGAGEMAARRAGERAIAAQRSLAAGARGYGAGAGGAAAQRAIAMAAGEAGGAASQAAMADQERARGLQAGVLQGMSDTAMQGLGGVSSLRQAELAARMQNETLRLGQPPPQNPLVPIVQTAGMIAASQCDERVKTDVRDASSEMDDMCASLSPVAWRYLDEFGGHEAAGVMAQDMERSAAGSRAVIEIGGVKHIDAAAAVPLLLGVVARLHDRIASLEALASNRA